MYPDPKYRPSSQAIKLFYSSLQSVQPTVRTLSAWQDNQQALTFCEEMKPVMIMLRIIGVLPYSTTSAGNRLLKHQLHGAQSLISRSTNSPPSTETKFITVFTTVRHAFLS
jgi:hypothetical protein